MTITADMITDEQIRELLASIPDDGGINAARRTECHIALRPSLGPMGDVRRHVARGRCAAILNAREVIQAGMERIGR